MIAPHRSLLRRVRELFKQRRERNLRLGKKPSLRFEPLEPRLAMHAATDHIHPRLSIYIDGQRLTIPANIGVPTTGDQHAAAANPHTHDASGILHLGEGATTGTGNTLRLVKLDDFFDVWRELALSAGNNPNSRFDSTHIMDKTVDSTHTLKMYVNGTLNNQFENYEPEDGDDVVISYETIAATGVPDFAPPPTSTVLQSSPLMIPLDGSDPENQDLSYTVTVANPNLLQAVIQPAANRSMKVSVENFGDMVFQLFEDKVPRVTDHMGQLAQQGVFNNTSFYRVVEGFVIQGGPSTGSSALGRFDDQFHVDLQHNKRGILSMAKSTDDTNDTEFFITDTATRFLDFNHSVWGVLVEGDNVRDAINVTPTHVGTSGEDSTPDTAVKITSVSVFDDKQNGVLMLKGIGNQTGETDVTVTVRDSDNRTRSRTFHVFVTADSTNGAPFLNDVPAIRTTVNTPATFTLTSQDAEGDAVSYTAVKSGSVNSTVTVNATTGAVSATPPQDFVGTMQVTVTARSASAPANTTEIDSQLLTLTVAPNAPSALDLLAASDSGVSNSDNITNQTNTLQFQVSGVTNGATVQIRDGNNVIGTATATGTTVTVTTNVAVTEGARSFTTVQTLNGVQSAASTALAVTVDTTAPATLTSTTPTEATVGTLLTHNAQHAEEGTNGFRYGLSNAPAGVTIDPNTGILNWTPTAAQLGQQTFAITVTDAAGNARSQTVNVNVGDTKQVEFRLAVTSSSGQAVTSLNVGQTFQLRIFARDTRATSSATEGGPFAAYLDVTYDGTRVGRTSDAITHGTNFQTAKSGDTSQAGVIDEIGATSGSLSPLGNGEFLIATIPLQATASGTVDFLGNAADVLPGHNVLVFGNDLAIPTNRIVYGSTNLVIQSAVGANLDTFNVNEDTTNTVLDVLANDTKPAGFTGNLTISQVSTTDKGGTVAITQNGTRITYTPPTNFVGADFFTYNVTAGIDVSQARVNVQVANVNDAPVAVANAFTANQNSVNNIIDVLANDTDLDTPLGDKIKVTAVGTPSSGQATIGPNGTHVVYTPATGFSGTATFTYTIADNAGATSTATTTVTVNTSLSAVADAFTVNEDSTDNSFTVLANDVFSATVNQSITVTAVGTTNNGTASIVSGGGSIQYTPKANFQGTDTFTYTITDANGLTSIGNVTVTVTNTNDPPDAVNDTLTALKNGVSQSLNVLINDSFSPDPTETLVVQSVGTGSQQGTLSVATDGKSVLYTPQTDFLGDETFTYTISDGHGGTDTATVTVTVANFRPSMLSGLAFVDANNDGVRQTNEQLSVGVSLNLTGTDTVTNQQVTRSVKTDGTGAYSFANLAPGNYTIQQTPLPFLLDGKDVVGTQGGTAPQNNTIVVPLTENVTGTQNNFAQRGRDPRFVHISEFLASRNRNNVLAAVNQTAGMAWNTPGNGWTDVKLTDVQFVSNGTQLELTGTQTNAANPAGLNVKATISATDTARVQQVATNGSDRLIKFLGNSSAFNFQALTTSGSGEGESATGTLRVTTAAPLASNVTLASAGVSVPMTEPLSNNSDSHEHSSDHVHDISTTSASTAVAAPQLVDAALSHDDTDSDTQSWLDFLASSSRRHSSASVDAALSDPNLLD